MTNGKIYWLVCMLLSTYLLAGCMDLGNGRGAPPTSTPPPESSPTTPIIQSSAQPPTALATAINWAESTEIGESAVGTIYEWQSKLYVLNQEGIVNELGAPHTYKYNASLSADGSSLLYNRSRKAVAPDQLICDLSLLNLESGLEMNLLHENQTKVCHSYGWLGNQLYVQWVKFPASYPGEADFSLFDGQRGVLLESGRLYQHLVNRQTRIVLLHPTISFGEGDGLGSSIRIAALTKDGAFHILYDQEAYEVQFLDIQVSESLGAMSVWTHQVPSNTSKLWMASVDTERWTARDGVEVDLQPNPEGGTISFDEGGSVVLSDGRRFDLP